MTLAGFLFLMFIAAVCGTIGQSLAGYSVGGCITSIVVGFIGAFIGRWIGAQLGLPEPLSVSFAGESFPVLWSIIGSALFVAILALITRRRAF